MRSRRERECHQFSQREKILATWTSHPPVSSAPGRSSARLVNTEGTSEQPFLDVMGPSPNTIKHPKSRIDDVDGTYAQINNKIDGAPVRSKVTEWRDSALTRSYVTEKLADKGN